MNIDHSVLVRFVELSNAAKKKKRTFHLVLTPHGIQIRGYDMTNLKEFLSFDKIIRWETLSKPAAIPMLEAEFATLNQAIDNKVESGHEKESVRKAT